MASPYTVRNERKEIDMKYRQWCNMIVIVALITLWITTPLSAQEMKGMGMEQMKEMGGPGLPTPNLLTSRLL